MQKLQNKEFKSLAPYFHPKLRVKNSVGLRIKKVLNSKLIAPLNYSIYRVWEINDASKTPIKCEQNDEFNIIPRYGYKKQYASMISVLAENDLARIYISYAKQDKKFRITGLHIQQWTHEGKDYSFWVKKSFEDKYEINRWIDLDIAEKLLVGGEFLEYPIKNDIITKKSLLISKDKIIENLNKETKRNDIVYFGSLLTKRSTGIFIRVTIDKQMPGYKLKDICSSIGHDLLKKSWFSQLEGGIRCNYIFKGMDPNEDSKIGGYYLTKNDLKNEKKDI